MGLIPPRRYDNRECDTFSIPETEGVGVGVEVNKFAFVCLFGCLFVFFLSFLFVISCC